MVAVHGQDTLHSRVFMDIRTWQKSMSKFQMIITEKNVLNYNTYIYLIIQFLIVLLSI